MSAGGKDNYKVTIAYSNELPELAGKTIEWTGPAGAGKTLSGDTNSELERVSASWRTFIDTLKD